MTSLRQIAANRRNALNSTGPITLEGKQRSRCNSVRHGLTAETVISTLEDADDYHAFEAAVTTDYEADTAVERELVLRLASLLWRLRRANGIETALFESSAAADANSCIGDVFLRLAQLPTFPLDRLSRYEHLLWRQARQIILTLDCIRRCHKGRQRVFPFPFGRR